MATTLPYKFFSELIIPSALSVYPYRNDEFLGYLWIKKYVALTDDEGVLQLIVYPISRHLYVAKVNHKTTLVRNAIENCLIFDEI